MSAGFIGLGNIGKPMALHWAGGKQALVVFDMVPQATVDLVAAGARVAATVAELAREAEIIGICVRDDKDVEQVLSGAGGILENARPNTVVLIHSTVKQESILEWHERGKRKSPPPMHIIDASVTRATLPNKFCYMLGGDAALVDRCRPLLTAGGNAVVHAGPVGAAIALKLCNNMMTYALVHRHSRGVQAGAGVWHRSGNAASSQQHQWSDHAEHGWVHPRPRRNREAGRGRAAGRFRSAWGVGQEGHGGRIQSAKKHHISLPGAQKTEELIADVFVNRY